MAVKSDAQVADTSLPSSVYWAAAAERDVTYPTVSLWSQGLQAMRSDSLFNQSSEKYQEKLLKAGGDQTEVFSIPKTLTQLKDLGGPMAQECLLLGWETLL